MKFHLTLNPEKNSDKFLDKLTLLFLATFRQNWFFSENLGSATVRFYDYQPTCKKKKRLLSCYQGQNLNWQTDNDNFTGPSVKYGGPTIESLPQGNTRDEPWQRHPVKEWIPIYNNKNV